MGYHNKSFHLSNFCMVENTHNYDNIWCFTLSFIEVLKMSDRSHSVFIKIIANVKLAP